MEHPCGNRQAGHDLHFCLSLTRRCACDSFWSLQTRYSDLKACDSESGKELRIVASSFDAPIALRETVPAEEFLDHEWDSVYQLTNTDLADAVGDDIYIFPFSYRGGSTCNDGFLMRTEAGLFLFSGSKLDYPMITLAEETIIDDFEDDVEEDIDELDFSMM